MTVVGLCLLPILLVGKLFLVVSGHRWATDLTTCCFPLLPLISVLPSLPFFIALVAVWTLPLTLPAVGGTLYLIPRQTDGLEQDRTVICL